MSLMKKILTFALALTAFSFCLSAQDTEQIQIKTPPLPNDPTVVDIMHYTKELQAKKVEIQAIYKNQGKKAAKEFLKTESPQIYNTILHNERQKKTFLIVGGSMLGGGAAAAVTIAALKNPGTSVGSFVAVSCCAGVAIVGAGIALAGIIGSADAARDGVILYKRAVDDEINNIKVYSGGVKTVSLGATRSGGLGLNIVF